MNCCDPASGCEYYPFAQPCTIQLFADVTGCADSSVEVTANVYNTGGCDKSFTWTMTKPDRTVLSGLGFMKSVPTLQGYRGSSLLALQAMPSIPNAFSLMNRASKSS